MKKTRVYLLISCSCFFSLQLSAQITFQKTYGGNNNDIGYSVEQTEDGGYILVGESNSFSLGDSCPAPPCKDVYLIKTNECGDTLWSKVFGGVHDDVGYDIEQTNDGGYAIAGYSAHSPGKRDSYFFRLDQCGDLEWSRAYDNSSLTNESRSVHQTNDGNFIIAGSYATGGGSTALSMIKINTSGDTIWARNFKDNEGSFASAYAVLESNDGSLIIGGSASYGFVPDMFLIKTTSAGDTVWTKKYGSLFDNERGYSIDITADGGYIIVGETNSFGAGNQDVYVVKTDSIGDTLWTRTYGGGNTDIGRSIKQTYDGGYIIAGETNSFGAGMYDVYLIKINGIGDTIWTRTFGDSLADYAYSVLQTADSGYVITGHTNSFGVSGSDVLLIKTDQNGNSGCYQSGTNSSVGSTSTIIRRGALLTSGMGVITDSTSWASTSTIVAVNCSTVCNSSPVQECSCSSLSTSIAVSNAINCYGGNDGGVTVTAMDGTSPYSFLWSNSDTTSYSLGLVSGTYSVTVTDSNGCTIVDTVVLNEPSDLLLSTSALSDTANTGVGAVWVVGSGGTSPYQYEWDDLALQTTDTAVNLIAGTYTVVVTDSNGCVDSAEVTVGSFTGLETFNLGNSIKIFPNPNTGQLTLEMNLQEQTRLSIKLYHFTGQLIRSEVIGNVTTGNYTQQIDLSKYAKGIYYVQIMTEKGVVTRKVIYQ